MAKTGGVFRHLISSIQLRNRRECRSRLRQPPRMSSVPHGGLKTGQLNLEIEIHQRL
jgi:hypothetical protein